jgi:hypothetical protein
MTGSDEPTTRGDFPGGFPGDRRNAFSKEGRTREEEDLFQYIRTVNRLHTELESLKHGRLVNLYVAKQQYAYARTTTGEVVIIVLNNDLQPATIEFDVTRLALPEGSVFNDRLEGRSEVHVRNGRMKVNLPRRSAGIFVRK